MTDSAIIQQMKLLTDEEVDKIREEFKKQGKIITGSCFAELQDNIDKHFNK